LQEFRSAYRFHLVKPRTYQLLLQVSGIHP
jgi:hypothetical protein